MLRMNLTPSLRTELALECPTCLQNIRSDRNDDLIDAAIFGAASPYVFCPGCLQETSPLTRENPEYQRRARVKMYEKYGKVVKIPVPCGGPV